MKTFEETYQPYNFTDNHTYIFTVNISDEVYTNIQHKLPAHIQKVTGVFVSAYTRVKGKGKGGNQQFIGILSMCFNGQAFKTIRIPVQNAMFIKDCSLPFPLDEELKTNSFIQGYFIKNAASSGSLRSSYSITKGLSEIKIYIHYQP